MLNKYVLLFLAAVLISSFSQILLKKSAMRRYTDRIREYLNLFVITGYMLMFLSMILTIAAYKGVAYKNGMILESLGNVVVLLFSHIFLKEKMGMQKITGMILILCGFFVFYL